MVIKDLNMTRYPFDTQLASFRFELSHFAINKQAYRMDLYRNETEVNFKPGFDRLSEFDIDFNDLSVEKIVEKKDVPGPNGKESVYYYPGSTTSLPLVRDPASSLISSFFPTLVIGAFIAGSQ